MAKLKRMVEEQFTFLLQTWVRFGRREKSRRLFLFLKEDYHKYAMGPSFLRLRAACWRRALAQVRSQ
jgi:hypothetical protein